MSLDGAIQMATIIGEQRCENCCYSRRNGPQELTCRVDAPHAAVLGVDPKTGPMVFSYWPPTRAELWCGRWRPRLAS